MTFTWIGLISFFFIFSFSYFHILLLILPFPHITNEVIHFTTIFALFSMIPLLQKDLNYLIRCEVGFQRASSSIYPQICTLQYFFRWKQEPVSFFLREKWINWNARNLLDTIDLLGENDKCCLWNNNQTIANNSEFFNGRYGLPGRLKTYGRYLNYVTIDQSLHSRHNHSYLKILYKIQVSTHMKKNGIFSINQHLYFYQDE